MLRKNDGPWDSEHVHLAVAQQQSAVAVDQDDRFVKAIAVPFGQADDEHDPATTGQCAEPFRACAAASTSAASMRSKAASRSPSTRI
ncbi:MAG: hypothetical protein O3A20_03440 [Planctomycetota bacterium]|nr:hypothetical protein [Planctomycetota bacterium]